MLLISHIIITHACKVIISAISTLDHDDYINNNNNQYNNDTEG